MCTFLTVGVDRRHAAAFHASLRAERFELSTEVNPKVAAFFEPTHALFMVTVGGCSCGLGPPSHNPERENRAQLRRWKKRGYSDARIARIRAAMPPAPFREPSRHDRLVAAARKVAPVRMCFHEVRGNQRAEDVDEANIELVLVLP